MPSLLYTPDAVLPFGEVSVATEVRMSITVFNAGNAGGVVNPTTAITGSDKFTLSIPDDLLTGLAPGRTSTITVTYRPCPAAWNNDMRDPNADLTACPGEAETADLVINDNTLQQVTTISVTGRPVQPPSAGFRCVQMEGLCNMPDATRSECVGMRFGTVVAGSGNDCDLVLEVRNQKRRDAMNNEIDVDDLTLERAEIKVREVGSAVPRQLSGEEAGFEILNMDGSPASFPVTVSIPPGESFGAQLFRVRFKGTESGSFLGSQTNDLGLRAFTNDPDNTLKTILISATGSSPNIQVVPNLVDFGPVSQGSSKTSTLTVSNQGDTDLMVTGARIESGNPEFQVGTIDGMPIARTVGPFGLNFGLTLTYTPTDPANDEEILIIASNDPDEPEVRVRVFGGPTPQLCFQPQAGVLEFPITDPPTPGPRTRPANLISCGTGQLTITGLNIVNSGNPESVDDYSINLPGCQTLPCTLNQPLCPQDRPNCMIDGMMPGTQLDIPVVYENNDTSTQDLADLVVTTNSQNLPELRITLDASDNPCLPPSGLGVEVVSPMRPCVPTAVVLRVTGNAGGPVGAPATFANCDWDMVFGTTQTFVPDDSPEACTMTEFLPQAPGGLHLVAVTVRNSCGAESTTPPEQIQVAPNCN